MVFVLATGLYAYLGFLSRESRLSVAQQGSTTVGATPREEVGIVSASPTPTAQMPAILFISDHNRGHSNPSYHYGLAQMNPATGELTWLSRPGFSPPYPASPRWAPDGSGLVYYQTLSHPIYQPGLFTVRVTIKGRPGDMTLYFVDRAGEKRAIYQAPSFISVQWAPTGEGVYIEEWNPWQNFPDTPEQEGPTTRLVYVPLRGQPVILAEDVATAAAPSPDGAWVAYVRRDSQDQATAYRIHLQPAGGGEATVPSERIVEPGRNEVRLRPAGDQGTVLTDAPPVGMSMMDRSGLVSSLAWSPDARWLTYTASRQGTFQPVLVDPSTGEVRSLTTESLKPYHYVWSPTGERIAAAGFDGLYLLRPDGGTPLRLSERQVGRITWSPDGTYLAYTEYDFKYPPTEGQTEAPPTIFSNPVLHVYNLADGSDEVYPTGLIVTPRWSPDGRWIVFADLLEGGQDIFNRTDLYVLDVTTGEITDLGEPGDAMEPVWVPETVGEAR